MKTQTVKAPDLSSDWIKILGTRRATLLRRLVRKSGLPPEVLVDLALEILDLASRKLAPSAVSRQAVGLGAARWRNVDPEERSRIMRRAVEARWAKQRHRVAGEKPKK
ncbi:MAG: hypothetical protein AB7N65_04575 [Vicinamibacterales bacterium]